jgi:hypothetical protein
LIVENLSTQASMSACICTVYATENGVGFLDRFIALDVVHVWYLPKLLQFCYNNKRCEL